MREALQGECRKGGHGPPFLFLERLLSENTAVRCALRRIRFSDLYEQVNLRPLSRGR